jgi:pilus assembly protein Flp/PilA
MLNNLFRQLENWISHNNQGQDLAEYAVFIGLIALVVVISITLIGGEIRDIFFAIATAIQNGV